MNPADPLDGPAIPSRRRRRRVIGFALRHPWLVGVSLLVLVTFAGRFWWGRRIERRLDEQNAVFHARGQATALQDVRYPQVPDDENAWLTIEKAAKLDDQAAPSTTNVDYPSYPPFTTQWQIAAQHSEVSNAPVLALARRARGLPLARVRDKPPSLVKNTFFLRTLSGARQVAMTVGDSAFYCNLYFHDDLEAVERLRDLLGIGRATLADDTLVGVLVSAGIDGLTTNRILIIAPGLTFDRKPTRDAVNALIHELLDESKLRPAWLAAVSSERLMGMEYLEYQADDNWVLRPLIQQDEALAGRIFDFWERAALSTNAESAIGLLRQAPAATRPQTEVDWAAALNGRAVKRSIPNYAEWYETMQPRGSYAERYLIQLFRAMAARRMAAVSLAARIYRLDNDNQWPHNLRDLVPKYLPTVPEDPFHADGRPLEYVILRGALPGGGDRPLVSYDESSTGKGPIDTEPMYDLQHDPDDIKKTVRQYRDLARWAPVERRFDVEQRHALMQSLQNQLNKLGMEVLEGLEGIPGHNP